MAHDVRQSGVVAIGLQLPWLAAVAVPWLVAVRSTGVGLVVNLGVPVVLIAAVSPALTWWQRRRVGAEEPVARSWRWSPAQIVYHLVIGPWYAAGLVVTGGQRAAWTALLRADRRWAHDLLRLDDRDELLRRVRAESTARAAALDGALGERRRLERDLHDGVQQHLVAVAVDLALLRNAHPTADPRLLAGLTACTDQVTAALREVRAVVRGFRPPVLDDQGLDAALSGVIAASPLAVDTRIAVHGRLPEHVETALYFVVTESLTNAARHGRADHATIVVQADDDVVRAIVTDDGVGGACVTPGGGLFGLTHRVRGVNGTLQIDSPDGGPTVVTAEIPCA